MRGGAACRAEGSRITARGLGMAVGPRQPGVSEKTWGLGKEGRQRGTPGFTLSKAHFSWVYSANLLMKESSFSGMMTL